MRTVTFIKWVKSNLLRGYEFSDETAPGDPQYLGFVDKSGNWCIMKVTALGVTFAKGTEDYHANFSNCEGLTYSYYFKLFRSQ